MAEPPDPLPADPAELVRIIRDLEARKADPQAQVKTLKALIFGAKSERTAVIDPDQGVLDLGDLAVEAAPAANDNADCTSGKPRPHPRRPANRNVGALPRHLPRVETTIEPESTACPCCAGPMHRIGEDVAEALDVIPALVRVLHTIRPKYACRCCHGTLAQAAARPRVVDGGMATTALVAHVVVAKFAWHLVSGAVKANDLDRLLPWAWKAERDADAGTVRAA